MNKKIAILGNSISLLLCPPRKSDRDKTYHEHLEEAGFTVINASKQSVMLSDVYRYMEDEVIRHFPEYLVINMGIVEATFRTKSRWLHNYVSENAWNNEIVNIAYCSKLGRGVRRAVKSIYRPFGKILYFLRIKWRFMPPRKYRHALQDIIRKVVDCCPIKKVIILGMLPISPELERVAPGTRASVEQYNSIMSDVAKGAERSLFVKMSAIFTDKEMGEATIDSIHFTSFGHKKVAAYIAALIKGAK